MDYRELADLKSDMSLLIRLRSVELRQAAHADERIFPPFIQPSLSRISSPSLLTRLTDARNVRFSAMRPERKVSVRLVSEG